ncbi:protein of unknown function DUF45 [Alkalidesulfovibrio alkalitolerans DSM 16529]|jgi:predicted metal-dependent hydrolase|uniref:YgjP-like metallopeptidase domain-containing protein n=1 Tax=Alkalidesulfovibrio alkalitolerans DSM 16529 TaxID=1121439 RepID=S7UPZ6_9BACT|nr:SprT family zinc-dependent metalloprotease [Alkalidesulfovibrio alkalitolerans]EPR34388.1 protein of unknown function DUF45 [Alkalidesulfovibrio alkalitolerans DSM 16529]
MPANHDIPDFSLRTSPRALRVSLRLSMERGLEVVVPPGFDPKRAPEVVARKAEWIARAVDRLTARHGRVPGSVPLLPDTLPLRALDEAWDLSVLDSNGPVRLRVNAGRLILAGADDAKKRRDALLGFVCRRARETLPPLLRALAAEAGEEVAAVQVRAQRSRWGSCSARGVISLNCRLLFLPFALTRYVLRHELAHLRRMDHSPAFWARVAELDPDFERHERGLSRAASFVPPFLA